MERLAQMNETPTKSSKASQLTSTTLVNETEEPTYQTPEQQISRGLGDFSLGSDVKAMSLQGSTPDSPLDPALLAFKYPQTTDEFTVNVALLTLLNGLMADRKEVPNPWKLDRYVLHFNY